MNYLDTRLKDIKNGYIQHFGILGMKWGIRKYQNPDGTLTNEGKKRYRNAGIKFGKIDFSNTIDPNSFHNPFILDRNTGFYKSLFGNDQLIEAVENIKKATSPLQARKIAKQYFPDFKQKFASIYGVEVYPHHRASKNKGFKGIFYDKIRSDIIKVKYKKDIPFIKANMKRGKDGTKDYLNSAIWMWDYENKKKKNY